MLLERSHKVHIDKSHHKAVTTVVVAATTAAIIFYSEQASARGERGGWLDIPVMIQPTYQSSYLNV